MSEPIRDEHDYWCREHPHPSLRADTEPGPCDCHMAEIIALRAQLAAVERERDEWRSRTEHAEAEGCEQDAALMRETQRVAALREALLWIRNRSVDAHPGGPVAILIEVAERAAAALRATPGGEG